MNIEEEQEIEQNLFSKMEQMERDFVKPGVQLSIKRRTDGTINYVRRCMNANGDLLYNARWNVPFSSPTSVTRSPPVQERLALMPAPAPPVENVVTTNDDGSTSSTRRDVEERVDKEKEKEESEDEVEVESKEQPQDDEYVPPSEDEESEDFSFQSVQVDAKRDDNVDVDVPTDIDTSFLTQEVATYSKSAGPAGVTPSPKFRRGYCQLCQNSPCVSLIDGPFLIKIAEKKYEKADASEDNTDLLQKLSEDYIDAYKLIKQHQEYLPGDGEIIQVDVPMCIYSRFHEWKKNLL